MIQNPCTYEDIGRAVLSIDPGEDITGNDDNLSRWVQTIFDIKLTSPQVIKLTHCITCLRASEKPKNDSLLQRPNGPSRESTSITADSAAEAIKKLYDNWKDAKVYACVREDMFTGLGCD